MKNTEEDEKMPNKVRININFPTDQLEKIDLYCKKIGQNRTSFILTACDDYLRTKTFLEESNILSQLESIKNQLDNFGK